MDTIERSAVQNNDPEFGERLRPKDVEKGNIPGCEGATGMMSLRS